ncbi:MAG: cation diffusion facilitator family transporter [Clostridiales bacterium]
MENNVMDDKNSKKLVMQISIGSIIVNVVLSIVKFIAGVVANSGAMISDSVHSASDVFSTFIVIFGYNASQKQSDADHQYGHERMECVAAIILASILAMVGFEIGVSGVTKIIQGLDGELAVPGQLALWAAVLSIVVKEAMFWVTRWGAKKIDSSALMADAWHHRSDAMSSVGAFVGIFGAIMGFPILDPIASLVICFFILKAAFDIFRDAIGKMTDKACDDETVAAMKNTIIEVNGVLSIDEIRTRLFGNKIYVDLEIGVNGELKLNEAHAISENVHNVIEEGYPKVKHCMVHVNPFQVQTSQNG